MPLIASQGLVRSRKEMLFERFFALAAFLPQENIQDMIQDNALPILEGSWDNVLKVLSGRRGEEIGLAGQDIKNQLESLRFKGEMLAQDLRDPFAELALTKKELLGEMQKEKRAQLFEEIRKREEKGEDVLHLMREIQNLS